MAKDAAFSPLWTDLALTREKAANGTPIVTIFGAGVAGLSVAHELIERGFAVQVVEVKKDPDEEYACQVGGLAANQIARLPADVPRLHPYLYDENPGSEEAYKANDADDPVPVSVERGSLVWVKQNTPKEELLVRIDDQKLDPISTETNAGVAKSPEEIRDDILKAVDAVDALDDIEALAVQESGYFGLQVRAKQAGRAPRVSVVAKDGEGKSKPSELVGYENVGALGVLRAVEMQEAANRFRVVERIQFERPLVGDWRALPDDHGVTNDSKLDSLWKKLKQAFQDYSEASSALIDSELEQEEQDLMLSKRMRQHEQLFVEIRAHTDGDGDAQTNRELSLEWGIEVRKQLLARNVADGDKIEDLHERLVVVPLGGDEPLGNPRLVSGRRRSNRVEFRIVENAVPGEHGYRFFPRFYKHLFDSMKRTPILDDEGLETGETAFDQLEATDIIDLAFDTEKREDAWEERRRTGKDVPARKRYHDPEPVSMRAPRSIEELRRLLWIHLDRYRVHISERDIVRLQYKLLKFLTTSSARRKSELEKMTWWEYLGADQPGYYSEQMQAVLQDTPQALAAMNAQETDARTMGTVYCQLLLDSVGDASESNHTLNGPTSTAWFDHWKRYLRRQGVRFFCGRLESLVWLGEELLPKVLVDTGSGPMTQMSIILADRRVYDFSLYGQPVPFDVGLLPRTPSTADVAKAVAQAITAAVEIPARADVIGNQGTAASTVRIEPAVDLGGRAHAPFQAGESLVTVERPGTSASVVLCGVEVTGKGSDAAATRADLLTKLLASEPGQDLSIQKAWKRSIHIAARINEAVVSVRKRGPGEFGVRINGHPVSLHAKARWGPGKIRKRLREKIESLQTGRSRVRALEGVKVDDLGDNALRFRKATAVEVSDWNASMALGPLVDWGKLGLGETRILLGGWLDVATPDPGLGVLGAQAESPGDEYVASPFEPGPSSGGGPDFYVLAVDYPEASRLVWQAYQDYQPISPVPKRLYGVFEQLQIFDVMSSYRTPDGELMTLERDGGGRPTPPEYPLRDLSGIQYFFEHLVRVGEAHTYFMQAPWGLSSISQLAYWRRRQSQQSAFIGQVSVDIGNFYRATEHPPPKPTEPAEVKPSALHTPKQEIALETWRQIKASLSPLYREHIVNPRYYHLDHALRFEDEGAREYGVPVVIQEHGAGSGVELEVAGKKLVVGDTSAGKLPQEIQAKTDHLAVELASNANAVQVAIAPLAANATEVRLVVLKAQPGVDYLVAANLSQNHAVAKYKAVDSDVEKVRNGLIAAILAQLPGVVAEPDPNPTGDKVARGIRLRSTQKIRVSAIAWDKAPAPPGMPGSLLALNPTGAVRVKPIVRIRVESPTHGGVIVNRTPYMINCVGPKDAEGFATSAWRRRAGIWNKNMLPPGVLDPSPHFEPSDIMYIPTKHRWLMVGNQMATTTRVSSMESANESARHAVGSILHQLMTPVPSDSKDLIYNGQGDLLGDIPRIWDPEKREIPDAEAFKRLDELLVNNKKGQEDAPLPHFLDILGIEKWVENLPELSKEREGVMADEEELTKLLKFSREQVLEDWDATQLDEMEKAARQLVRTLLREDDNS